MPFSLSSAGAFSRSASLLSLMRALGFWAPVGVLLFLSNMVVFSQSNDSYIASDVVLDPLSIDMALGEYRRFSVQFREPLPVRSTFKFTYRNVAGTYINRTEELPIKPLDPFIVEFGSNKTYQTSIVTQKPGVVELGLASSNLSITHLERLHARITVYHQKSLSILQQIVGWTYFLAWTLSFYPQVVLNCRRQSMSVEVTANAGAKSRLLEQLQLNNPGRLGDFDNSIRLMVLAINISAGTLKFDWNFVTGLSFDFVVFNIIGFACYSAFNIGLFFVPRIQEQYFARHSLGVIPVEINDLFFSLHGVAVMLVVIIQCLFFERGNQRVSKVCIALSCLMILFILTSTLLAAAGVVSWLTALYLYSYVKLFVTLIKYFPQLILNCRRRSCVGWSVGNFILDFIGGVLSVTQMFINAYNYDDWSIVYGSPTKLGLGLLSIAFDCGFFIQHHLYRRRAASTETVTEEGFGSSEAPLLNESANANAND